MIWPCCVGAQRLTVQQSGRVSTVPPARPSLRGATACVGPQCAQARACRCLVRSYIGSLCGRRRLFSTHGGARTGRTGPNYGACPRARSASQGLVLVYIGAGSPCAAPRTHYRPAHTRSHHSARPRVHLSPATRSALARLAFGSKQHRLFPRESPRPFSAAANPCSALSLATILSRGTLHLQTFVVYLTRLRPPARSASSSPLLKNRLETTRFIGHGRVLPHNQPQAQ